MTPTREEVIRVALEVVGDYRKDDYWPFFVEELERLARHFYEAGLREFQDQAWKLIDALEEVRGARTRGEEDWKALNKADAALRRELQQATGEKT